MPQSFQSSKRKFSDIKIAMCTLLMGLKKSLESCDIKQV